VSPRDPRAVARLAPTLLLAATLLSAHAASGQELRAHGGPVRALGAAADGGLLLSGSFDTSLIAWRPAEATVLHRFQGHDGAVNAVAVDRGGTVALSGGEDGRLIAWDLANAKERFRRELAAKVLAVALDTSRGLAAAGTGDGAVHLLTLADGAVRARLELDGERPTALLFLPDGELLVAGHLGGLRSVAGEPAQLRERRPATGFAITDLALADERTLAASAIDGTIRLFALPELEPVGELTGHEAPISALAAEPGGRRLASGDLKGRIVLWSLADKRAERVLEPHAGPVWDLAFTGPRSSLWSAGNDAVVRRWAEGDPPPEPTARTVTVAEAEGGERGAKLFRACRACHTLEPDGGNRAGPTLFRLFGRPAGSVPGYPYSEALARSGIVWTEETVDKLFALGPETFTPGSKMPLQRMPDPGDRAALIAYLKRVTMPEGRTEERGR
jgi:cytochrome c